MAESVRILGLELAGAKNDKTALAVLEHFPADDKTYLLHLYEGLGPRGDLSADHVLLSVLREARGAKSILCVNVPLQFPPCTRCQLAACRAADECRAPAVLWAKKIRAVGYTPYTQRPVEVWLKKEVVARQGHKLELDETLGGARAPLTARMVRLREQLDGFEILECLPKLTASILVKNKRLPKRLIEDYRALGRGGRARAEILGALSPSLGLYLGPSDQSRASRSLAAFDALVSGVTGLLFYKGKCVKPPRGFPSASGWIHYPQ